MAGTTNLDEREELKRLLILHAQLGMVQSNRGYAEMILKTLANLRSKFALTPQDLAREATVQAWTEMQRGEYDAAATTAKKAIQLDANCADAHRVAASIDYMTDQMQSALASANKAVQIDPLNSINRGYRGLIYTDLGDPAKAIKDLNEAHRIDPNNTWVMSLMTRFAKLVGLHEAAIMYQGLPYKGDYTGGLLDRCELFAEAGLPQLAVQDAMEYAQSTEQPDTNRLSSIMAVGMHTWLEQTIAFGTGGPTAEEVISVCDSSIKAQPDNLRFLMLKSDVLRRDRQFAESLVVAKKLLSRGATFAVLFQHVVHLELKLGDIDAAIEINNAFQQQKYDDADSVAQQKETAGLLALSAELVQTLRSMKFTSETGTAMATLLASPEETPQVFQLGFAREVSEFYESIRPETKGVTLKPQQTRLQIEWTTTEETRAQDAIAFEFDDQLARVASDLSEGHTWFTVRCKDPQTDSGPSFGYFVKTDAGWRIFPKPWTVRD